MEKGNKEKTGNTKNSSKVLINILREKEILPIK